MNDVAEKYLLDFINDKVPNPSLNIFEMGKFKSDSYKLWAATELLDRVSQNPLIPADETIFNFWIDSSIINSTSRNPTTLFASFLAKEVAEDALKYLETRGLSITLGE